jgi:hypothetical protein
MRKSIIGLVAVLLCCASAFSQQAQRNPVGKTALREIIPGHYAFSSGSFNSGIIVTDDGAVVRHRAGGSLPERRHGLCAASGRAAPRLRRALRGAFFVPGMSDSLEMEFLCPA